MKTMRRLQQITSANLRLAVGKSLAIPASMGYHLARGFQTFALANMTNPGQLGNDAFTEAYFTTASGNFYRIWRLDEDSPFAGRWAITNVRDNRRARKDASHLKGYAFSAHEAEKAVLKVGTCFHFGTGGMTSEIVGIIAVNTNRCYIDNPSAEMLTTDIRNEFKKMIE